MKIRRLIIDLLINHAVNDAPIEACGYLAEKEGIIELHIPLKNSDASMEHFSFDPKDQFEAVRSIRAQGFKLKAVYHSHSTTPARPSAEDIRMAFDPNLSYVIISLKDSSPIIKSFRINKGSVEEEEITIVKDL